MAYTTFCTNVRPITRRPRAANVSNRRPVAIAHQTRNNYLVMGAKQTTGTQRINLVAEYRETAPAITCSAAIYCWHNGWRMLAQDKFLAGQVMLKIKVNRRRGDMDKPGNISLPAACARVWVTLTLASQNPFCRPRARTLPHSARRHRSRHQAGAVILGCLG